MIQEPASRPLFARQRAPRSPVWLIAGCALVLAFAAGDPLRAEEYRLQSGDIIDLSVIGANVLGRRMTVGIEGEVRLPLGGTLLAAGLTIDLLRERVATTLSSQRILTGVSADGTEIWSEIYPEMIILDIAEYRPVYVVGDVIKPGEQAFRPGLTAGQALSVAGGLGRGVAAAEASAADLSIAEAELEAALKRRAALSDRIERIAAELGGEPALSARATSPDSAAWLEDQMRVVGEGRAEAEAKASAALIAETEARLSELDQLQVRMDAEVERNSTALTQMEAMLAQGIVQVARVDDARRSHHFSLVQALENRASTAMAKAQLIEFKRDSGRQIDERRQKLLDELGEARTALAEAEMHVAVAEARLGGRGGRQDDSIEFVASRAGGDGPKRLPVTWGTVLLPGDVLEVTIPRRDAGNPTPARPGG